MSKKVILVDQIAKISYKYTFSLAECLIKQGVDVHLVLDLKKNDEVNCKTDSIFLTDEKNVSKVKKVFNLFSSYRRIRQIIKEENIDILHIQWINFSPIEYHLLKRIAKKTKIVMTVHDILPFNEKGYDKRYYRKIYHLPSKIIVQADTNYDRFKELFPEDIDKVTIIPHGNSLKYADLHPQVESREKIGVNKDYFTFLFFGQIKQIKGVDILLEAFEKFHQNHPESQLVVAGKLWYAEEGVYEKIFNRDGYPKEFLKWDERFIGDEEIGYYYSACDVTVLPYKDLYQSGVIQLAYAYKKVPIVSNLKPFLEVVDENSGYIFENENVDSLVEAMEKAFQNKKNADKLVENGIKTIKVKYNWEDIAKKIIDECYDEKIPE